MLACGSRLNNLISSAIFRAEVGRHRTGHRLALGAVHLLAQRVQRCHRIGVLHLIGRDSRRRRRRLRHCRFLGRFGLVVPEDFSIPEQPGPASAAPISQEPCSFIANPPPVRRPAVRHWLPIRASHFPRAETPARDRLLRIRPRPQGRRLRTINNLSMRAAAAFRPGAPARRYSCRRRSSAASANIQCRREYASSSVSATAGGAAWTGRPVGAGCPFAASADTGTVGGISGVSFLPPNGLRRPKKLPPPDGAAAASPRRAETDSPSTSNAAAPPSLHEHGSLPTASSPGPSRAVRSPNACYRKREGGRMPNGGRCVQSKSEYRMQQSECRSQNRNHLSCPSSAWARKSGGSASCRTKEPRRRP